MSAQDGLIVLAMVLATQLSRLAPIFLSSRFRMSEAFERWLKYVPISVLAALVVPDFFQKSDGVVHANVPYLIAGALAFAVGAWRKNLLLTACVGVATVAILRG